ncbi:carboxymuconolactone decarboxylase family protein [Methanosarcina sp. KYL-1]|uniref:carboxymuconolactone decarboxylase family protein n=1 Tax=Methanosarcina sp. KYL-1 TaxID=2602068 RepID=UPI0021016B7C|nr:carboxymuconolactone decarboxylase family protein [Methanosarcina sp. KYL-1]MCQ1534425.1 carboxymuconolactone decarboxylase family protein [Methanosarcina sp. KYL-1]
MSFMNELLPDTAEAFGKMRDSIFQGGELDRKTKELIAVASSVLMRCQFCTDVHSQRALAHGASKKEIAEAIAVAMFISAGSQLGWTNIYDKNVYELIFEDKKPEEPTEPNCSESPEKPGEGNGCCCGN